MKTITIHDSGEAGDRLRVDSIGGGIAYAVYFGEEGSPMRAVYFQGEDADRLEAELDELETARPDDDYHDLWLAVLDPYL